MPNHGGVPCVAARVATRRGYRRKAIRRPNRDATQRRSCPAHLPGKQSPKAALLYFGAHAGRDSELSAPGGAFSAFADSAGGSGSVGAKPQAIRAQSRTTGRAFLIIVEARAGYQDQRPSPQGRAFLHRAGLRAARRRLRHSSPSCHADPLAREDQDERPHELVPELAVREERLRQVVGADGATPRRAAPAVSISSPCPPGAAAHARASGMAAMLAHSEVQGSPSCKANVRSRSSNGRPKLVKCNDRNAPMAARSQTNLNHCVNLIRPFALSSSCCSSGWPLQAMGGHCFFRGRLSATGPGQTLALRRPGSAVEWAADTRPALELKILSPEFL